METAIPTTAATAEPASSATLRRVIFASSLGTLFEWYDFYLYGTLAVFFGGLFFPPGNETAQLLASLATFGAGFGVRPLGALVFGHIGDLHRPQVHLPGHHGHHGPGHRADRRPAHLRTARASSRPSCWSRLRLLQGLALGGEYGGAATYVAEHVPDSRRGYYTSYIQTTATLGFFLSMGVIGTTRTVLRRGRVQGAGAGACRSCCRSCCSPSRSTSA